LIVKNWDEVIFSGQINDYSNILVSEFKKILKDKPFKAVEQTYSNCYPKGNDVLYCYLKLNDKKNEVAGHLLVKRTLTNPNHLYNK
jgi:hypothetical protein